MALPEYWEKAEAAAKIAAVVIGGGWVLWSVLRKRELFPRANVSHKFTVIDLDESKRIVRVELIVENIGERLLTIRSLTNWLQQILPLAPTGEGRFTPTQPTSADPEIGWPLIKSYQHFFQIGEREIEPGEHDSFQFDHFVENDVTMVQVYSYVTNPSKWYVRWRKPNRPKEIGWQVTDVLTLPAKSPSLGPDSGPAKTGEPGRNGALPSSAQPPPETRIGEPPAAA